MSFRAVDAAGIERSASRRVTRRISPTRSSGCSPRCPRSCRALHLPVQSGSNHPLRPQNRRYTREHYLGLIEKLRRARPDIALSTDIIVGFPGETEENFMDTYRLVEEVGYSQVFTFIYSKREGPLLRRWTTTRPATSSRSASTGSWISSNARPSRRTRQSSAPRCPCWSRGTSKRDDSILAGKSPKNQTVHAPVPAGADATSLVGRIVPVTIEEARTWYLSGTIVHA